MDNTSPRKIEFLDGMRAAAMLIVLAFHVLNSAPQNAPASALLHYLQRGVVHGQFGVVVFIVLSGYCLALPVAGSPSGELRGGFRGFIKRRALRILPAYYAALFLSTLLAFTATVVTRNAAGAHHSDFGASLSPFNLITHLFLIHNWWFETAFLLNGEMWSVATEWHIYFVFALLLLPLWRRFGLAVSVVFAYLLGIAPALFLPPAANFYWMRPWYLGLFAIGMAGPILATWGLGPVRSANRRPVRPPYAPLFALTSVALLVVHVTRGIPISWQFDTLIALWVFCFIGFLSGGEGAPRNGAVAGIRACLLRALESRPMRYLAGISYSTYLTQHIFLKGIEVFGRRYDLSADAIVGLNIVVVIPALLVSAHFFAKVFEQRSFAFVRLPRPVPGFRGALARLRQKPRLL